MGTKPLIEVSLRKYEPPTENFRKNLRFFLLSIGIIRPGDADSLAEKLFFEILSTREGVTVSEIAKKFGVSESAVRYHITKLKELRLIEGRGRYRITEGDLQIAFLIFKRYVIGEILDRIEVYVRILTE